ncbi:MAG TPA: hypothetical protein V6D14_18245 [Coleofasciculaceae cyanobacterium]
MAILSLKILPSYCKRSVQPTGISEAPRLRDTAPTLKQVVPHWVRQSFISYARIWKTSAGAALPWRHQRGCPS